MSGFDDHEVSVPPSSYYNQGVHDERARVVSILEQELNVLLSVNQYSPTRSARITALRSVLSKVQEED